MQKREGKELRYTDFKRVRLYAEKIRRDQKKTSQVKKQISTKIWYLCLFITVISLFLQGTPASPIPLRQRDEAQIHSQFS